MRVRVSSSVVVLIALSAISIDAGSGKPSLSPKSGKEAVKTKQVTLAVSGMA